MTTTQQQRHIRALEADFIQVHELGFEQLLVCARELAGLLPYRDHQHQDAGNWKRLFAQDDLVICAAILAIDPQHCKQQYKRASALGEEIVLGYLLQLYQQFDSWYRQLPDTPDCTYRFKLDVLHQCQQLLKSPLHQILASLPSRVRPPADSFDSLWQLDREITPQDQPSTCSQATGRTGPARFGFSQAMIALKALQQRARAYVDTAMNHGEHAPELALYLAFLKLFERAQQKINRFSARHLDFYYRQLLEQSPLSSPADQVYLKFSRPTSPDSTSVSQDHTLSPGKDAQFKRILYSPDYPIEVTDAEVAQVLNLNLRRDPAISPEHETGFACALTGNKVDIDSTAQGPDFPPGQRFVPFSDQVDTTLPIGVTISDPILAMAQGERTLNIQVELGELAGNQSYQQLYRLKAASTENDVIAELSRFFRQLISRYRPALGHWVDTVDPYQLAADLNPAQRLLLPERNRTHQYQYLYRHFFLSLLQATTTADAFYRVFGLLISRYTLSATQWLNSHDKDLVCTKAKTLLADTSLQTVIDLISFSRNTCFYRLFSHLFTIEISTAEGWLPLSQWQITPLHNSKSRYYGFTLNIHVHPGTAPFVPATSAIHGIDDTNAPTLKLTLRAQSNCYPYSIFRDFEWVTLRMDTQVRELTDIQLFNSDGQADPSQPFPVFGTRPTTESALVIANEEIARKQLTSITLNMIWSDLPRGSDGFRQHYAGFKEKLDNHCFRGMLDVLHNGQWQPLLTEQVPLFQPEHGTLQSQRRIETRLQQAFVPVTRPWPDTPFSPQSPIRNGLFRLRLTSPDTAFGDRQYPALLTQALMENARRRHRKPLPLPNAPYTPKLASLTLDYSARSELNFSRPANDNTTQVCHLHPFGRQRIFPAEETDNACMPRLLANYQADGQLSASGQHLCQATSTCFSLSMANPESLNLTHPLTIAGTI